MTTPSRWVGGLTRQTGLPENVFDGSDDHTLKVGGLTRQTGLPENVFDGSYDHTLKVGGWVDPSDRFA